MKLLASKRAVEIPEGLTIEVKGRQVRVKGPRGANLSPAGRRPPMLASRIRRCKSC